MSKLSFVSREELCLLTQTFGLNITNAQSDQLLAFNVLLNKWTKHFNLVSTSTLSTSISRHVLDSLSVSPFIDKEVANDVGDATHASAAFDVMDIGSGAGLPVLPLAIVHPELQFMSVETNGKKVRFQRQVVLELGLKNVGVRHERVEAVSEQARNVISRAFTAPDAFLKIADNLCIKGGQAVIMLGQVDALPEPLPSPWQLKHLQKVTVPGEDAARHVAVCTRDNRH